MSLEGDGRKDRMLDVLDEPKREKEGGRGWSSICQYK